MAVYKQLNQVRENSTNAVQVYSPNTGDTAQVHLKIANVSVNPVTVSVFHDNNGTTWDQTTAITYGMTLAEGQILELDYIFMQNSAGSLAYQSGAANALTATVYGVIS